jgi:hypothetical protein
LRRPNANSSRRRRSPALFRKRLGFDAEACRTLSSRELECSESSQGEEWLELSILWKRDVSLAGKLVRGLPKHRLRRSRSGIVYDFGWR